MNVSRIAFSLDDFCDEKSHFSTLCVNENAFFCQRKSLSVYEPLKTILLLNLL